MRDIESGHTLESSYWTGEVFDVEEEFSKLDNEEKRWKDKDVDYETVGDLVASLYEG